jgi:hypothetical protein
MTITSVLNEKLVDDNGYMSSAWLNMFTQWQLFLQNQLADSGYVMPQLTNTQIAALDLTQNIGAILYNTTTNQLMVNINGTLMTVTVS